MGYVPKKVYLGLGGNIGNSAAVIQHACAMIQSIEGVCHFEVSRLYQTAPVSDIPQADYINAVCRFDTELALADLWGHLQAIEKKLGKVKKAKNEPRVIDVDILFFGNEYYDQEGLQIPHPRWKERLFVLEPLKDLTLIVHVPIKIACSLSVVEIDLAGVIQQFSSNEMEKQCIKCL